MFRCPGECGWLHETRHVHIRSQNGSIGICFYIGTTNFAFSNAVQIGLPPALISWRFGNVHASWCMTETHRCSLSIARSVQKFDRKNNIKHIEKWNGVANSYLHNTFSYTHSGSPLGVHGLQLFLFATLSQILPTRTNTLDRSRHFGAETWINRRHGSDVWVILLSYIYSN